MSSRRPFDFSDNRFRHAFRRIPGPLGCLVVLVLLPLVLLGVVFLALAGRLTGGARRRATTRPATPQALGREVALCSFVRSLALEEAFTREEALATPVIAVAQGAPPVEDLLADGLARGWIVAGGDRMSVTPEGRRQAEQTLRRMDL